MNLRSAYNVAVFVLNAKNKKKKNSETDIIYNN